ncbi:hypothetical protein Msi02_19210 [Microbispora siamensis]|uniref:Uncharacterized protein n=1 Tax=Microbispora siamensis TaxID=564413 RepID=A0ABQ4GI83_9ACTN|nr:hypothetical protein Msi02_19210 [Microbispora siamensis]
MAGERTRHALEDLLLLVDVLWLVEERCERACFGALALHRASRSRAGFAHDQADALTGGRVLRPAVIVAAP